jgi:bifunctional enzyme CysN/CysC
MHEHNKINRVRQLGSALLAGKVDLAQGSERPESSTTSPPADQFATHLIWTGKDPMLPERTYHARLAGAKVPFQITDLVYRIDTDSLQKMAAKTLCAGEIGYCKIALRKPVGFTADNKEQDDPTFFIFDSRENTVIGAGIIDFVLRRSVNIDWHQMAVDKSERAAANQQKPCVLWFTGLSASGKTTIADLVEQKLHGRGNRTYLLDGDNVRHGLSKDLGFTDHDRVENIRRVAEVAKLMVDAGLIVITAFISPFEAERRMARDLLDEDEFIEIFVDTPLDVCEACDPKDLYRKARAGDLKNFTGIDSAYEPPNNADIVLNTLDTNADKLSERVVEYLQERRYL